MYEKTELIATTVMIGQRVRYRLEHMPAQVNEAGQSMPELWGALFTERSGQTGGRWYASEEEARAKYAAWTDGGADTPGSH